MAPAASMTERLCSGHAVLFTFENGFLRIKSSQRWVSVNGGNKQQHNVALGRLKSQKHSCFHFVLWLQLSGVDYLVGGTLARHGSLSWQSSHSRSQRSIKKKDLVEVSGSFTPWQSLTEDLGFGWSWWWCWAAVAGNSVRPCPSIGICWPSHGCTTTFVRPTGSFPPTCTANSCWDVFLWRCFRDFQSFVSWRFC